MHRDDAGAGSSRGPKFLYSSNEMENDTEEEGDAKDIRIAYKPKAWSKQYASYVPEPIPFVERNIGLIQQYGRVSSYCKLFKKFWSHETLRKICRETNRYVGALDENGVPRG
jgi:hypothetical protein